MVFTKQDYENWEDWGYRNAADLSPYAHPGRAAPGSVYETEAWKAWLAGAERAGREAYAAGKDLETEAAKIKDADTRIAFTRIAFSRGYPDEALVPAQEQNAVTDRSLRGKTPSGNIDATLAERGARYGQFKDQAVYADKINAVLTSSPNWDKMAPDQREALRIIANKIGRILNGDPDYEDNWHDIVGYAKLVDDRLNGVSQ